MLKLTSQTSPRGERIITIEGALTAETVGQLSTLTDGSTQPFTLDLAGITMLDKAGQLMLLRLRRAGSRLVGGSLYIQRLLEEV
jgi:hypothetical protein